MTAASSTSVVRAVTRVHMAFFPDLSVCDYFKTRSLPPLLAVGWLERGHEYARGDPGPDVLRRLGEFQYGARSWQPILCLGAHGCDLCGHGPSSIYNLFVPGQGVTYVAPEGIVHYISHHAYLPAADFCSALIASPTVNSAESLFAPSGQRVGERSGQASPWSSLEPANARLRPTTLANFLTRFANLVRRRG